MRVILSITAWRITDLDFYNHRMKYKGYPNYHWLNTLPQFCVREDNGYLDYTEYYYQFFGYEPMEHEENKSHIVFDYEAIDNVLKEEISNVGFEDIFGKKDLRPLFNKIKTNDWDLIAIPINQHIIIDLKYVEDIDDWDMTVDLVGYLDENLNLIKISNGNK